MSNSTNILPCPFCGSIDGLSIGHGYINCHECGIQFFHVQGWAFQKYDPKNNLVDAWNRRAPTAVNIPKKHIVTFVRYIRFCLNNFMDAREPQIDNLHRITLLITLDYSVPCGPPLISFLYSVCNGDNFSKKKGIEIAKKNPDRRVYVHLGDEISEHGVVHDILYRNDVINEKYKKFMDEIRKIEKKGFFVLSQ